MIDKEIFARTASYNSATFDEFSEPKHKKAQYLITKYHIFGANKVPIQCTFQFGGLKDVSLCTTSNVFKFPLKKADIGLFYLNMYMDSF